MTWAMIFHQQKEQSQHYKRGAETGRAGDSTGMQEQIHAPPPSPPLLPVLLSAWCFMDFSFVIVWTFV